MPFKVTFFFKADDAGFAENWYASDASDTTGVAAAAVMARAVVVAKARNALLGAFAYLDDIRVSDLAYSGDSLVTSQVAGPAGTATYRVPSVDPTTNQQTFDVIGGVQSYLYERDTSWNSIDCRATSTNLYRRQVFLRGIPDLWVAYDIDDNPIFSDAVFNTAWPKFVSAVIAAGFCIQSIDKSPTINPRTNIGVGQLTKGAEYPVGSGNFNWLITCPTINSTGGAVPTLVNGQEITISNVKGVNVLNLNTHHIIYNVVAGPPQTFQVFVPFPLNPPVPYYLGTGYWRTRILKYAAIDNILVRKYGSRKVGKRIGKQPGRLPAKKKF